jgi:hypothetical protein
MLGRLKHWAAALKRDVKAIYLAGRDPHVPWYAKALACCCGLCAIAHRPDTGFYSGAGIS